MTPIPTYRGHPKGLITLSLTEAWERFSFYGLQAILALYLAAVPAAGGQGMTEGTANSLFLVHASMVYLLTLPGGWVADRVLGTRRSVLIGGIIIAAGHYVMAVPAAATVYIGLALIAIGTGLLKANISSLLGELYDRLHDAHDPRRDVGFSVFYMGINIGALLAPIVVSTVAEHYGWHRGFGVAAIGMTLAVVVFVLGTRSLGDVGLKAHRPLDATHRRSLARKAGMGAAALAVVVLTMVLTRLFTLTNVILLLSVLAVVTAVGYFLMILRDRELSPVERSRMRAYVYLFAGAAAFWMIVDQAGAALNQFAQNRTDRSLFGFGFPAGYFQSLGPAYLLLLAPVMAALWVVLDRRRRNPSTPAKFAIGVALAGLSFVVMAFAAQLADERVRVSVMWLAGVYLIQSVGELFLSPVGLSATTKLAPAKYVSQMMGLWFLAAAVGDAAGDQYSRLAEVLPGWQYYALLGITAIAFAAALWATVPRVRRLMSGVD